jgi:hypothetical protein
MNCVECNKPIDKAVFYYSIEVFDFPLCRNHQEWIRNLDAKTTDEAIYLYLALRECGVPAVLEKADEYKTVDIAIEEAKVHIEVDGMHHNFDSKQAMSDLKRTFHSFKKGYFTLRIPNPLIRYHLEDTVDWIIELLHIGRKRASKKNFAVFKFIRR